MFIECVWYVEVLKLKIFNNLYLIIDVSNFGKEIICILIIIL